MIYATVKNNIVQSIVCGEAPEGALPYPDNAEIFNGCDVRFFTTQGERMSVDAAKAARLITVGANQSAVWENGKYIVKHDYTNTDYWVKSTREKRKLRLGEQPDSTLTTVEPTDPEAAWQSNAWVVPRTVKERRIRERRDSLLVESDYLLMPDYPIASAAKTNWQTYRQALRDVPAQTGFPDRVQWPTAPATTETE